MLDENKKPYAAPVNFVHESKTHKVDRLYFHFDNTDLELGIVSKNPEVFFNAYLSNKISLHPNRCTTNNSYISVSGEGTARIVTDQNELKRALGMIIKKYFSDLDTELPIMSNNDNISDELKKELENITVVCVEISKIVGKNSK